MNAQVQRVRISCPDSHSPCLLPMGGSTFGGHGFVLTVVWLVPQRYGMPTWVHLWGQEPCLCLTPRTWCYLCLLGSQPVLMTGWHLGLGEWSLNLAPQSWVWLAGLPVRHPLFQAVTLAVAVHLRVLHYLYSLSNRSNSQKVIRKAFPIEDSWSFLFTLFFPTFPCHPKDSFLALMLTEHWQILEAFWRGAW